MVHPGTTGTVLNVLEKQGVCLVEFDEEETVFGQAHVRADDLILAERLDLSEFSSSKQPA